MLLMCSCDPYAIFYGHQFDYQTGYFDIIFMSLLYFLGDFIPLNMIDSLKEGPTG